MKSKLMEEINFLDLDDRIYYKCKVELDGWRYKMYSKIEDTENLLNVFKIKKMAIKQKLTGDDIYKVPTYFDKLYAAMNEQEK